MKSTSRRSFCGALAATIAMLAGPRCRRLDTRGRADPAEGRDANAPGAATGDSPPIPRRARRIASLSPSTTESLFALGAGDRLVARSRYCDFPPEAQRLPVVGGYVDVSLEAVLALRPDLVVGARGPGRESLAERLGAFGIPTFFPPADSIDDVLAMIRKLAELTGMSERGAELERDLRRRIDAISSALADGPHPSTLLVVGASPVVAVGPRTFVGELLERAGARNVVHSSVGYPTLGIEELVALDPDLVIDGSAIPSHGSDAIAPDAPGFRDMRAIRSGRLVLLDDTSVLRPGPRVATALASLARLVHPGFVPPPAGSDLPNTGAGRTAPDPTGGRPPDPTGGRPP